MLIASIAALETRLALPPAPKYTAVAFPSDGNSPYGRFRDSLRGEPAKFLALDLGIREQLEVLGSAVAQDEKMGRYVRRGDGRLIEFKIGIDGNRLPPVNPDGSPRTSGYPKGEITLRVGCHMAVDGRHIFLFGGFDKGRYPNQQDAAIDAWFKTFSEFRRAEERLRAAAKRAG